MFSCSPDPPKSEPPPQTVPGNAPVPVMNAIPPQLNVLQHHYPMQGPRGPLPVSLQPAAPYAMPPQVPVHLHPAVPLLQVPAVGAQGLPPPPPPPPPMQQGSQTAAAQPDGYTTQVWYIRDVDGTRCAEDVVWLSSRLWVSAL